MEINSANISQVQQTLVQPQQQAAADPRVFEADLSAQEQAQESIETTPDRDDAQSTTADYGSLIKEARVQQATTTQFAQPSATNTANQTQDMQHTAIAAYQSNQESYESPTTSGQLLPRIDAVV